MANDWAAMTDEEIEEELNAGHAEQTRRRDIQNIPQTIAAMNRAYLNAEGTTEGSPWRQPTGAHDAYPAGFQVTHSEKLWESLIDANVWEPGVSGWREFVEGGGYPVYTQPTGGHDAYVAGDKVAFEGKCYESAIDANVWSPTTNPAGWTEIPCP